MFLYSVTNIFVFSYTKNLIEANSTDFDTAYNRYITVEKVVWWLDFTGEAIYNSVHWIFALKYWTLSFKVQLMKQGRDPDVYNRLFIGLFIVGILFNVWSALINTLSYSSKLAMESKQLTIAALVFTVTLYVSFAVLFDAFRRFRNIKTSEQVIKNMNVFALSFTFFLYAIGITLVLLTILKIDTIIG